MASTTVNSDLQTKLEGQLTKFTSADTALRDEALATLERLRETHNDFLLEAALQIREIIRKSVEETALQISIQESDTAVLSESFDLCMGKVVKLSEIVGCDVTKDIHEAILVLNFAMTKRSMITPKTVSTKSGWNLPV